VSPYRDVTVLARRAVTAAVPTTRPAAGLPAGRFTDDNDDRRQRAKQYWPIKPGHISNDVKATLSKQLATLMPVASTLLLVWTGL